MQESDLESNRKIILSDETHFHLTGFVKKQNCRIWGSEKPRVIVEKPRKSGGVIEHYFFENEAEATVTVNGLRYRDMINDFLWPELDELDTQY